MQRIKAIYLEDCSGREQPALAEVRKYLARDSTLDVVSKDTGKSPPQILAESGPFRQMAMDLLYRLGGMTNPEIGQLMRGITVPSARGGRGSGEGLEKTKTCTFCALRQKTFCQDSALER